MTDTARAETTEPRGYGSPLNSPVGRRVAATVVAVAAAVGIGVATPVTADAATVTSVTTTQPPRPVAHRSRFGYGTFYDCSGYLFISAPLYVLDPTRGKVPQVGAPVRFQVWTRAGWVTVKTLYTDRSGLASGWAFVGPDPVYGRVTHPATRGTTATTGRTHLFASEPCDI